MFTGIIEEIGTVTGILKDSSGAKLEIQCKEVINGTKLGDSIATNGVCLTVCKMNQSKFTVDVMTETLRKSSLGNLKVGSKVNLERALTLSSRLGGHIVSGHIDGVGVIKSFKQEGNATWVFIEAPIEILKYMVYKGSITIDGVSLTIAYLDDSSFGVSIIPHTSENTILLDMKVGATVNLECDVIGKYVERLLSFKDRESDTPKESKQGLSLSILSENGFI